MDSYDSSRLDALNERFKAARAELDAEEATRFSIRPADPAAFSGASASRTSGWGAPRPAASGAPVAPAAPGVSVASVKFAAVAPVAPVASAAPSQDVDLAALIDDERLEEAHAALLNGADPNRIVDPDRPGTALQTAAALDDGPMCAALIQSGAYLQTAIQSPDEFFDGWTALHFACKHSATGEAAAELLAAGADPFAQCVNGDTPLHVAASEACAPVAGLLGDAMKRADRFALAESGAAVDARNARGETPLHLAVRFCAHAAAPFSRAQGSLEVMRQLVAAGADVNARDRNGMTPLHLAFVAGSEAHVQWLAKAGASLSELNVHGRTPLAEAKYKAAMPREMGAHVPTRGPSDRIESTRLDKGRLDALQESAVFAQVLAEAARTVAAQEMREAMASKIEERAQPEAAANAKSAASAPLRVAAHGIGRGIGRGARL